jgi:ABC-type glycerol-3-phosphate transport system substrate-binding protein
MFQRKISRKEFLKLVTLGSGAAILVACAPAATQPVETAEQVNSDATQAEATATVAPTEEDVPVATDVPAAAEKTISLWLSPYQPTEWTERSAEHPTVVNATRVLAEQFQQEFPNVKFDWVEVTSEGEADQWAAWLTARIAAGDAPDLIWSLHNISVQNGWTLPIESYLDQPNPYAPSYAKWRDIFYPSLEYRTL